MNDFGKDQTPRQKGLCEECKEKYVISPGSKYCASCLARRSNKKRALKRPQEGQIQRNIASDMHKSKQSLTGVNTSLQIDFGRYVNLLREVEQLADEEMRSVDLQVVYMLSKYLEGQHQTVKVV